MALRGVLAFQDLLYFVCGLLIGLWYVLLYVLGAALRPGYSYVANSVSEPLLPGAPN